MRSHNCTASFSHLPKSFKQPEWSCERHQAQFLFHKWMSSEKMKYLKHTRAKAVPQSQRQSSEGMLRTASLLSEDVHPDSVTVQHVISMASCLLSYTKACQNKC